MATLTLLSFILFCLYSGHAPAQVVTEGRESPVTAQGPLTPFWAQELIGADLSKALLRAHSEANVIERVPIAVYDSGFEREHLQTELENVDHGMNGNRRMIGDHGTSVVNLINGIGAMSTTEIADYVQLKNVSPAPLYFNAFRELQTLPRPPRVISNSMGWTSSNTLRIAQDVDQLGIIWVHASGNQYPEAPPQHEQEAPVISVGSFSPLGLQSYSSQEHRGLDILAPSDHYLATVNGRGESILFGATSGAVPLVTGSIANALAVIPQLTRAQIENLLKATALPTFHQYYHSFNQAGVLNGYLFLSVVIELRRRCAGDETCLQGLLSQITTRRASLERLHLIPRLSQNPFATRLRLICQRPFEPTQEELTTLRKHFLLYGSRQRIFGELLSCAYQNLGYGANAELYRNLTLIQHDPLAMLERVGQYAEQARQNGELQHPALRDQELMQRRLSDLMIRSRTFSAREE